MKALRVPFAAGCLGGALFVLALLLLDIGGLGTLIARDHAMLLPLSMLLAQLGGDEVMRAVAIAELPRL